MKTGSWIGVDLDGTLAHYDKWQGADHIGPPIALMLDRVLIWLAEGRDVRIFTARVHCGESEDPRESEAARKAIQAWCVLHIGRELPITCQKDFKMIELWDDRAIQVIKNTGRRADEVGDRG